MKVSHVIEYMHKKLESWISVLNLAAKLLLDAFSFKRQTQNTLVFGEHYFFSNVSFFRGIYERRWKRACFY